MIDRTDADLRAVRVVPYEQAYQEQVVALVLHVQNVEYGIGLPLASARTSRGRGSS